jgi:hypothetical protein
MGSCFSIIQTCLRLQDARSRLSLIPSDDRCAKQKRRPAAPLPMTRWGWLFQRHALAPEMVVHPDGYRIDSHVVAVTEIAICGGTFECRDRATERCSSTRPPPRLSRCGKSSEPFSGASRTGLRHTKTEIGKWRAETAAVKPAAGALEFEDCRPETSAWKPNPRKCRSFSQTRKPNRRDPTGWLTTQSLANWSRAANSLLTEKFTGTSSILIHLHANAREQHPLIQ